MCGERVRYSFLLVFLVLVGGIVGAAGVFDLVEYGTPNAPSVQLDKGGSLSTSRTYCFRVVGAGNGDYPYGCSGRMMAIWSPPSAETCVTPAGIRQSVNITWNRIPEPTYNEPYIVYVNTTRAYNFTDGAGNYLQNVVTNPAWRIFSVMLDTDLMLNDGNCNSTDCWMEWDGDTHYQRSAPIYEDGIPFVNAYGGTENNPVTPYDLYDWLVNNQSRPEFVEWLPMLDGLNETGAYKFRFSFGHWLTNNSDFVFGIRDNVVLLHESGKFATCSNGNFTMGEYDPAHQTFSQGGTYLRVSDVSMYNYVGGAFNVYDSLVSGGFEPGSNYSAANFEWYYSHGSQFGSVPQNIIGSKYLSEFGRALYGFVAQQSIIYGHTEVGVGSEVTGEIMRDIAWNNDEMRGGYSVTEVVYKDFFHATAGTYAYRWSLYSDWGNVTHLTHFVNPKWLDPHTRFLIWCKNTDRPIQINEEYDLNLTVTDSVTGEAIDGATLTVQNVNGSYDSFSPSKGYVLDDVCQICGWLQPNDVSILDVGDYAKAGNEYFLITGKNATHWFVDRGEFNTTPYILERTGSYKMPKIYKSWANQSSNAKGAFEPLRVVNKWFRRDTCDGSSLYWWRDTEGNYSSPFLIKVSASGYNNFTAYYTPSQASEFTIGLSNATTCPDCPPTISFQSKSSQENAPLVLLEETAMPYPKFSGVSSAITGGIILCLIVLMLFSTLNKTNKKEG